jgi:outer membrane autotransporter protein
MRMGRFSIEQWSDAALLTGALVAFGSTSISLVPIASAQTVSGPDASGNFTTKDVNGNTYVFNLNNVSAMGTSTLPVNVTPAGGTPQPDSVIIQNVGNNLFSANGTLATGAISCTINTQTRQVVSGNCPPFSALFPAGMAGIGTGGMAGTTTTLTPQQAAAMAAAPSTQNAGVAAVRSQTLVVTNMISDRVRSISRDLARSLVQPSSQPIGSSYRGIAAGSADSRWGVWGDASGSFIGNDTNVGYDGTSVVALAGIDYILDPAWIVGFNTGYVRGNLGLKSYSGTRTSNGAVVGPYASYIISPNFSLDGQFSYTRLSNDIATVVPGPSGGWNSNRLTGAVNLNGYADAGPIRLTGFTGYAYTWEGSNNSILSGVAPFSNNIRFGVLKLGGEAGCQFDQLEPYIPLTFEYQTTNPQDRTGRAALIVGAGLRYQWNDQLKAGILGTATEFETHWRDLKVEANLRWTF